MPMTANIIHTAKQMVKATVLITSTDSDCCDRETMSASVGSSDVEQLRRHRVDVVFLRETSCRAALYKCAGRKCLM
jgi:hypothetical protein